MKMPQFPKEIKRGSVSVFIYKTPSKGYTNYTLDYYQDERRKREYSADYSAILTRLPPAVPVHQLLHFELGFTEDLSSAVGAAYL